ncbi:DUF2381 family protein [Archangium sp.]|uniref:DUF2381 family protein n=1 Tax=Archangium sp. TaxID=1872627 RepID=UPI002ED807A8
MLLLAGTSATSHTCPPPGEAEGRCIELTADRTLEVFEVQLSPGQPTTFDFDSDVQADGLTLENRERFKVAPGKRLITLVPSEMMRGEKPSTLTVCFADDAAPSCARFRLVIHPAVAERQVEIFRHKRPVNSVQAELKKTREEIVRLHAEIERLRAERDRPDGLTGLFASGMVDGKGIPSQSITKRITERESNTLIPVRVTTLRAPGRVAIGLSLENPEGAKPWTPQGAKLVGSKGEVLDATFWPAEPIPSGEQHRVWIEVMVPDVQTQGPFILKIWELDGQRTFVIGNVTFPALPVGSGL